MRRLSIMLVGFGCAAFAAGCGDLHLGDKTGRHLRAAFTAQAETTGADGPGSLDAEDAKTTFSKHHSPSQQPGVGGSSGGMGSSSVLLGGTGSGGMSGSSSGSIITPIKMEPK